MQLINITVPVFNEQEDLTGSIETLLTFLAQHRKDLSYEIVIANNASTDCTLEVARQLEKKYSNVRVVHLELKGRGRALKKAWLESSAEILSYMDVDLSTDLEFFPLLIDPLIRGTADLSTGSRLLRPGMIERGLKREIISRSYNLLVKALFRTKFSDAQCGFKAITRRAADQLLPKVEDTSWFFDTELLLLAGHLGYRIFDLPVRWTDDPDSRVKIVRTAIDDIKGLIRVRRQFWNCKPSVATNCQVVKHETRGEAPASLPSSGAPVVVDGRR